METTGITFGLSVYSRFKMGGMVKLDLLYHITDHLKVSMDIGYKSNGYSLGEVVSASPILKVSLNLI
nr:hypothetical protein [Candidatus Liberibacter solanacearum]